MKVKALSNVRQRIEYLNKLTKICFFQGNDFLNNATTRFNFTLLIQYTQKPFMWKYL